jgi:hypothetical protein
MGELQDYPTGTPGAGDLVPYIEDPTGTPALKLVDASTLGGGGSGNPWGLMGASGLVLDEEFDGTSGLTWTASGPSATWTVAKDVASVVYGGELINQLDRYTTPHTFAVGETVEIAARFGGPRLLSVVGLVLAEGTSGGSECLFVGTYANTDGDVFLLARDGPLGDLASGVNIFTGTYAAPRYHHRVTQLTAEPDTWRYEMSIDGVSWTDFSLDPIMHPLVPTHVGLAVSCWGYNTGTYGNLVAAFDYLRVY